MNPNTTTFKCLTNSNANPTQHPRSVPLKSKFSKLTLTSSEKKPHSNVDIQPNDKPLTPTPRMLSFSPEITDDEDDGANAAVAVPLNPATSTASKMVNKILVSSGSTGDGNAPTVVVRHSEGIADPCEGPSFSQPLLLNDTDITNCTELNGRRSSLVVVANPERSSVPAAVSAAAVAEASEQFDETMSNMEKLEITASSSEDLFNCNDGNGSVSHRSSSLSVPQQQRRQTIFSISSGSSVSSTPTSAQNRSTRSSLPSEDVYDVITLSDSQSEHDADIVDDDADGGEQQVVNLQENTIESVDISNRELPVVQNTDDRLCNISSAASSPSSIILPTSVSPAAAACAGPASPPSVAESLPSMVQHRLDNFFDNIPLLSSDEPLQSDASIASLTSKLSLLPLDAAQVRQPSAEQSHSNVNESVYVSETDEDDSRTGADLPHDHPPHAEDAAAEMMVDGNSAQQEQQQQQQNTPALSSELATVPSHMTATTSASTPSSTLRKANSNNRTPTVSISAKFKIRIHVNHNDTSTSESSSSSRAASSGAPSENGTSNTSQVEDPARPSIDSSIDSADVEVHRQAHRISQMFIGEQRAQPQSATPADSDARMAESNSGTPKCGTPVRPIATVPSGDGTPKSRKKLQLDKLKTPRTSKSDTSSDAENVPPLVRPIVGTPKSHKKLQLDKLKTPRPVMFDPTSDAEQALLSSNSPPAHSSNEAPKSHKKLQLDKLKTPRQPPVTSATSTNNENVPQFAPPEPATFATPAAKSKIVLDDAAQMLLNELYGVSWQTPELLKKCVIRREPMAARAQTTVKATQRRPPLASHASGGSVGGLEDENERRKSLLSPPLDQSQYCQDFSLFRRNIDSHLDSTRIDKQRSTAKPAVDPNPETPLSAIDGQRLSRGSHCISQMKLPAGESEANVSSRSDLVMRRCRLNKATPSRNQILSTSSSDGNQSDANRDDSQSASESSSSDDEYVPSTDKSKSKTNTSKRRNANSNNLTYLDLTQAEVVADEDHSEPDASDLQLQQISEKFLAEHAQNAQSTENSDKTPVRKRKLYNPKFECPDESPEKPIAPMSVNLPQQQADPDESDESSDEDEQIVEDPSLRVKLGGLLLPRILPPTNRRLESIRRNGVAPSPPPIVKQPLAESRMLNLPPVDPIRAKPTPAKRTPAKNVGATPTSRTNTTPSTLAEICRTPDGKYPFLHSLDGRISEQLAHPVAKQFRDKFRTKKQLLTTLLMELYIDRIFTGEYRRLADVAVTWNARLQTTAGRCRMLKRAGLRTAAIELSDKVCTSADRLRCTLIHELCHAATWLFQGETGHGRTWKRWATRANALLRELPLIERCHAYDIAYKYVYQCTLCGAKSPSHSKSRKVELIRCAFCHGAIEIYTNQRTPGGGQELCPLAARKVTGFAAYVKAEYGKAKQPGIGHADVMRLLSAGYAKLTAEEKKQY